MHHSAITKEKRSSTSGHSTGMWITPPGVRSDSSSRLEAR